MRLLRALILPIPLQSDVDGACNEEEDEENEEEEEEAEDEDDDEAKNAEKLPSGTILIGGCTRLFTAARFAGTFLRRFAGGPDVVLFARGRADAEEEEDEFAEEKEEVSCRGCLGRDTPLRARVRLAS